MTESELGQLLRDKRKKMALSQAYVAELAGISSRQLLKWEAGQGNPSFTQLQAVLDTLGLALHITPKSLP